MTCEWVGLKSTLSSLLWFSLLNTVKPVPSGTASIRVDCVCRTPLMLGHATICSSADVFMSVVRVCSNSGIKSPAAPINSIRVTTGTKVRFMRHYSQGNTRFWKKKLRHSSKSLISMMNLFLWMSTLCSWIWLYHCQRKLLNKLLIVMLMIKPLRLIVMKTTICFIESLL